MQLPLSLAPPTNKHSYHVRRRRDLKKVEKHYSKVIYVINTFGSFVHLDVGLADLHLLWLKMAGLGIVTMAYIGLQKFGIILEKNKY